MQCAAYGKAAQGIGSNYSVTGLTGYGGGCASSAAENWPVRCVLCECTTGGAMVRPDLQVVLVTVPKARAHLFALDSPKS